MTNSEYTEYLRSEEWQKKREQRIQIDNSTCAFCGRKVEHPVIHHLNYRNIGNEDPWTDLVCTCDDCHIMIHTGMCRITSPSGRRGWRDDLPVVVRQNLIRRGLM